MPKRIGVEHTTYRFEWDEKKNRQNVRKHGFSFAEAEEMFGGVFLFWPDLRTDYGEDRWIGIGTTRGRTAVVAFTKREPDTIRVISLKRQRVVSVNSMKKRSKTNWKRVDALQDSEIDLSEIPELGPVFFNHAIRWPGKKKQITLRLDPDVLAFFRLHGKGYQTTINALLRRYMEVQQDRGRSR